MDELIELERQKWNAFQNRDAALLADLYDAEAISIGYAADGSAGARDRAELLRGLDDLAIDRLFYKPLFTNLT